MPNEIDHSRAIAIAASPDYGPGLLVTLASLLAFSTERRFAIHIACAESEDFDNCWNEAQKLCRRFGFPANRLHRHTLDESRFAHLHAQPNGRHLSYLKCQMAMTLEACSLLVLDADLLVMDDVDRLLDEFESHDWALAAVVDECHPTHAHDPYRLDGGKPGGHDPYFNSGVFLTRPEYCRRLKLIESMNQFGARLSHQKYTDQTLLNLVFRNRWKALHPRWNRMTFAKSPAKLLDGAQSAGIIHYAGNEKPWSHKIMDVPNLMWRHLSEQWDLAAERANLADDFAEDFTRYCRSRPWRRLKAIYHGLRKPGSRRHMIELRRLALPEEMERVGQWLSANGFQPLPSCLTRIK